MNPLWILAAAFGALTLKNPFSATPAGPQGMGPTPFDPNLPPEIAAGVIGCAAKCGDPQQMLAFAQELAKQRFPIAAIYLQTRAAMLIQARARAGQAPAPQQAETTAQVEGTVTPPAPTPPPVPQAVKNIQRTLSPEQNAKFEEFLEYERSKAVGLANGKTETTPATPSAKVMTKEV